MTAKQHGGKREGAGRPKGSLNRRSLAVIEEVAERYPHWSPLLHLASVANDETLDPEIRLDAAKAAAPYCHAKLRPVVADADELVELEGRIAAVRAKATVKEITGFGGLAERLKRAKERPRCRNQGGPISVCSPKDQLTMNWSALPLARLKCHRTYYLPAQPLRPQRHPYERLATNTLAATVATLNKRAV